MLPVSKLNYLVKNGYNQTFSQYNAFNAKYAYINYLDKG